MEGMCNYLPAVTTVRGLALKRSSSASTNLSAASWREATIVFFIFTAAQIADGLLTYWGEGHNLASPANIVDLHRRVIDWLGERLAPREAFAPAANP